MANLETVYCLECGKEFKADRRVRYCPEHKRIVRRVGKIKKNGVMHKFMIPESTTIEHAKNTPWIVPGNTKMVYDTRSFHNLDERFSR